LNFSYFIARKVQQAGHSKGSIIGPIITASTLAIGLGMVLMIVSMATGFGLKKAIGDKIVGFFGHITISNYDINNSFENAPIVLTDEDSVALFVMPNLNYVQPFATKAGILKGSEDFEGVVLKGVDSAYNWHFFENNLRNGQLPTLNTEQASNQVLLSTLLANKLKVATGDTVRMYFIQEPPRPPRIRNFIISGLYETGLEEFDKTYLIGDLRQVQRLNGWQNAEVGGFEIFVIDANKNIENASWLRNNLSYTLDARSVQSQNEQLYQWLKLFDINLYLIIAIMIIVALINMVNALLILILDRTNMIGLLKALGASNAGIIKIFLYQSAHIVIRGMLWGNIIGLGFCFIQSQFQLISLDPQTYYVSHAPIYIEVWQIVLLNGGVFAICVLFLVIPALLVSKISPVRALRYA